MEGASVKSCGICTKESGKYQCPRCNILYCSADCYKATVHSYCSEQFYEECVRNEMSSLETNSQESQKKMYEILKRLHENNDGFDDDQVQLDSDDDSVDEDDIDLAERLKGIDLDEADKVWDKLTDSEKRQFEELLKSNDVTDILPEFEPWWNYKDDRKVVDLEEVSPFEEIHKRKCPEVDADKIVPFSKISRAPPASTICYNLVNVIAAYVFAMRYFNGDHHDCASETGISVITASKNLWDNENFFDFISAVKSVILEVTNCDFLQVSTDVGDTIISDVKKILEGPDDSPNNKNFYVLSALSDMHKLFSKTVKYYNMKPQTSIGATSQPDKHEFSKRFPESGISALPSIPKLKIKSSIKKIEYYLSWSMEYFNSSTNLQF